jgi:hypothetical protein
MATSAVSGVNTLNGNFYRTKVTDEGDGIFSSTLFRTDAQGKNEVPIAGYGSGSDGVFTEINTTNATPAEQQLLSNPNSVLNQTRQQQTQSLEGDFFPTAATPDQQAALAQAGGGSGNTASTTGTPDEQGGSTPTAQQQAQPTSSGPLIYPIKMKDDQDRIKFQALTYSAKALPNNTSGSFETTKPSYSNADVAVFLPIQASISDQNSVGWEPDTLNPIELKAVQLSMSAMENPNMTDLSGVVGTNFQKAMETLKKDATAQAVRTYLAGQAVGVNNLLSRLNGQVLNSNLELLFQGPQLRPFNFTFKLSPRSLEEAKVVKKIIRYFKKNMAPIVGDQGLFIKAPNVFKIEYQYGTSSPHPGINLIKECALTNCSVDYTPNGTYMTYPEGTMVSYTLSLQFQELEPVYSRDYDEKEPGKSHSIGY